MKSLNKIQLIGYLGKDPDVRYNTKNEAMVSFSLATSDTWKDKENGENKSKTEWHNIYAYRQLGELIGKYLKKGSRVYLEGKVQTRKYKAKDGTEKYTTEVICNEILFLDNKDKDDNDTSQPIQHTIVEPVGIDDDIPF